MHNHPNTAYAIKHSTILQAAAGKAGAKGIAITDNRPLVPLQAKAHSGNPVSVLKPPPAGGAAQWVVQRGKKYKGKKARKNKNDDEDEYVPPRGKKQNRFTFPKGVREKVLRRAHKRKHVNRNFKAIYTCPACSRPLAYETKKGRFGQTRFAFTSKSGKRHEQVASTLDHYPRWAERERALIGRGASKEEIKEDHNDPTRLRPLCKACNESHKYEKKKNIDYESADEDEGYHTPDDEPENKGFYSQFRYDKDDPPGDSGGITV